MDFTLTEEQQLLSDTVARFAADVSTYEVRPTAEGNAASQTDEIWSGMAELGLLGLNVPEGFGGIGADPVTTLIVMERFGEGLLTSAFVPTAVVAAFLLGRFGTTDQRARHLPAIADGRERWAIACHEPDGRYDLARIKTRAERHSDGYLLHGRKDVVIGGDVANQVIVSAMSADGPTLVVVPATTGGVRRTPLGNIDGLGSANLVLDGVHVASGSLLGRSGEGLSLLQHGLDFGVTALCAESVGAMSKLATLTFEYLRIRRQFGQPLGRFQALQHRAAEMMTAVEQSRSITYFATSQLGATDPQRRSLAVSSAKATVARHSRFVGQQAIQLHGGIGVTEELPVGRYFRRLMALDLTWGDAAHHSGLVGASYRATA